MCLKRFGHCNGMAKKIAKKCDVHAVVVLVHN